MASFKSIAALLILAAVSASLDGVAGETAKRYQKDKQTCGKLLQVPAETLEQYLRSEYAENHDTFCYIRCIAILQGHYDDETGLVVDSLYETANLGKTKEEFTELLNGCQAQVTEEVKCHCHRAFIPVMCFRKHFHEWQKTVGSAEEAVAA